MKQTNSGFSIMIWMWIVLLMTLTVYVLLDYIIPYSKNIKWVENSTNSYYQSYAWIEKWLFFIKNRPKLVTESWSIMPSTQTWYSFETISSWTIIPITWEWNSDYNKDYNKIYQWSPIQLEVWWKSTQIWDIDWSTTWWNVFFIFKIPDIANWNYSTLSGWNLPVINWILSADNNILISTWSYIKANEINWYSSSNRWEIAFKQWKDLYWNLTNFQTFHDWYCNWVNSWCTLKMSILNKLITNDWRILPYLEYKISFWTQKLPSRYTTIKSSWKSYWFQKNLEVKIPQQTTSEALDFTVFQ